MSLNFDSYGRLVDDVNYDGSQLGSMELYNLKIQKVIANFTEFDAVTKAYVDKKMDDLVNGASTTLDTLKEIESYLTDNSIAGSVAKELSDLSSAISSEAVRASGAETVLSSRVTSLENNTASGASVSALQSEVDASQVGAGLNNNGQYVVEASRHYISAATSLKSADALLDSALYAQVVKQESEKNASVSDRAAIRSEFKSADDALDVRINNLTSGSTQAVTDEAKARDDADSAIITSSGLNADGTFPNHADSNYMSQSVTAHNAREQLDTALGYTDQMLGEHNGAPGVFSVSIAAKNAKTYSVDAEGNESYSTAGLTVKQAAINLSGAIDREKARAESVSFNGTY